jgi:hypothetical protein
LRRLHEYAEAKPTTEKPSYRHTRESVNSYESIYMAYSDFDLKKVKSEFNLDIVETDDLVSMEMG